MKICPLKKELLKQLIVKYEILIISTRNTNNNPKFIARAGKSFPLLVSADI